MKPIEAPKPIIKKANKNAAAVTAKKSSVAEVEKLNKSNGAAKASNNKSTSEAANAKVLKEAAKAKKLKEAAVKAKKLKEAAAKAKKETEAALARKLLAAEKKSSPMKRMDSFHSQKESSIISTLASPRRGLDFSEIEPPDNRNHDDVLLLLKDVDETIETFTSLTPMSRGIIPQEPAVADTRKRSPDTSNDEIVRYLQQLKVEYYIFFIL